MRESRVFTVLFLCTHNSARSVLAEALLNRIGADKFRAFSAGSYPSGTLNPFVLEYLQQHRLPTDGLRSKSWEEFSRPGAAPLDFVITVCDQAAGEVCPVWPGQPMTAHWGVEDPSRYKDDPEKARKVVREVAQILNRRLSIFAALPLDKLDRLSLRNKLGDIGTTP
jgi:arsenate reductase